MKTQLSLLLSLVIFSVTALAQTPSTIEKVEITGISDQTLSPELRDSIQKLNGQPFNAETADQIATRIQTEVKDVVAAARALPGTQPGRVRLVFVVAHSSAEAEPSDSNVNSQYIVESVEVKGVLRSDYSEALFDDMQKMVGEMLDNKLVESLQSRLLDEPLLKGKYAADHKIERGSQPEHVKVVFSVHKLPWIVRKIFGDKISFNNGITIGSSTATDKDMVVSVDLQGIRNSLISEDLRKELQTMVGKQFDKLEADHLRDKLDAELKSQYTVKMKSERGSKEHETKITYEVEEIPWIPYRGRQNLGSYHQKQGVSIVCCEGIPLNLMVGTDGDTLTERFKGYSMGLESRSLWTRHLGARLDLSTFGVRWKSQTVLAQSVIPNIPGLYRSRQTIEPSIAYAFNRNFYITAGAKFTELSMISVPEDWQSAHEATASFHYDSRDIKRGRTLLKLTAGYDVRTGTRVLSSDFVYTRHQWDATYEFKNGSNKATLSLVAGRITGSAPLFERFSLGNTQTLRGWNKYDLDPVGGSRMVSVSTKFTHSDIGLFIDTGSIWNEGQTVIFRQSLGVALGPLYLAFPLRCSSNCGPTFLIHF